MDETNITDSITTAKESPDADDADGVDLSKSNADKVSESSESKSEPEEASESSEKENVLEKDNVIDNSSQESDKIAEESDSDDDEMFRKKPQQRKQIIVSDDEDSNEPFSQVSKKSNMESESSQKSAIESDKSDDSDDELLSAKESKKKKKRIINSDSDDDSDMEMFSKSDKSQSQETKTSYNRNIFDTETSDEEERRSHHSDEENNMEMSKSNKKKPKEKKPKEPTLKDREKDRLDIASESQRMQREATFSLPYHKPKQRTLAEFLNRRKSQAPLANTRKGSLKSSMRNPEILKRLESRKNDIEEFYKSDDENAEDPEDGEWKPGMEPKRTDSDKDSDDEDMETEAEKSISEAKIDSKEGEISVNGNEGAEQISNDIVSSESKDEKVNNTPGAILNEDISVNGNDSEQSSNDILSSETKDEKVDNTPGAILDEDELPDIYKNPSDITYTSKEENMQIEESKSKEEQIKLSEGEISDNLLTDILKSEISSISTSKTLVNDSGIQSGTSSSNEDHDSNDATDIKSTNIDNEKITETNIHCSKITRAENIESSDYLIQGTQSTQNMENDTAKMGVLAAKIPSCDLKVTPKLGLGASSGDFIDLDEDTTPKDKVGLDSFLNRFIKHAKTKRAKVGKRQVNLGVVQKVKDADGQENLETSSITVELEEDEDHTITEEVPGAKRVTLKEALKAKMREQREQERLRRVKEKKFMDSEDVEGEDPILDDEGETDEGETDYETESEPEENDVIITDKKRKKNKFMDEEADEDDMEDDTEDHNGEDENDVAGIDNDDDDSNDTVVLGSRPNKKHNIDEDEEDSDTNNEDLHLEWENTQDVNKGLHRTETQDMFESQSIDKHHKKIEGVDKDSSMTSMDSSFEFFGSMITAHQPGGGMKNPQRPHLNSESQDISNIGFLTPLLKQKTESFGSVSKGCDLSLPFENSQELCSTQRVSLNKEESQSPTEVPLHLTQDSNSQFETKENNSSPGAKLRLNFVGATQTQGTADELAVLCSGQFTGKTQDKKETNLYNDDEDDMADTQNIDDLMGLCSGRFNTQPSSDADIKRKGSSGAFSELFDSEKKSSLEDDDLVGLCTGKFTTQKEPSESTNEEVTKEGENSDAETQPRKMIIDSDDEDLIKKISNKEQKKQKRKRKRIVAFGSDDEDDNAVNFVPDFDDEENEMPKKEKISLFKDKAAGGIRKDFLDAEAELSGSEDEVSDDEADGDDDDFMEMEAGDADNYDDDELRDQVGRAHMKAEMDADRKRVRLLQEMYLEDGDLHSTEGRQRSFRWANNDNENDDSNQRAASDEEDHNEEEAEDAEWRKQRFEREKFLQEKQAEKKDDENEPDMFKIRAPLVRTTSLITTKREPLKPSNQPDAPNTAPNTVSSQPKVPSNPFCMPTKRGSFLSRNKSALAKIAEFNKEKGNTVGGAKTGGNFVFQQLSAEEVEVKKEQAETKLNRSVTAPAMKRARLDRSFFSLDETKQKSSLFKHL